MEPARAVHPYKTLLPNLHFFYIGEMVEWIMAPVLKTGVGASLPWVRIPLSPDREVARVGGMVRRWRSG